MNIRVSNLEGNSYILHTYIVNNVDFTFDQTNVTTFFPPTMDRILLGFRMNSNSSAEGTISFQITSSQATHYENFPHYQNPLEKVAFYKTSMYITVSDCKLSINY